LPWRDCTTTMSKKGYCLLFSLADGWEVPSLQRGVRCELDSAIRRSKHDLTGKAPYRFESCSLQRRESANFRFLASINPPERTRPARRSVLDATIPRGHAQSRRATDAGGCSHRHPPILAKLAPPDSSHHDRERATVKLREGRTVMRAIFFRLALVGAMSAVAPIAHAQLLTHRDLSYSMAKTIAETAIDSCAAKGYAVSAVVVDRAGDVIVAMRADNAGPHTMENARRKAYTARSFRTSTTAYAKRFADNDPVVRQQVTLPNVIAIPGGLPVKLGDEVIAGVGVSGSPGVDEPCVQAGLEKSPNSSNEPIRRAACCSRLDGRPER